VAHVWRITASIRYCTVDMSLSDVHLCSKSPMLMRTVLGIGTASIHSPSLLCTCIAACLFTWAIDRPLEGITT